MTAVQTHHPASEAELCAIVAAAAAAGTRLSLIGGGTKAATGAPVEAEAVDMRGLAGMVDYDPAELVLTVAAGTPLSEIEALVAARGQMLAFAPFDLGPLHGQPAGASTIGGVLAAGVAGSARVANGGARDHLLGFRGVSGRGETFVAGARVVKNVTGFDLSKLVCGSWGRLVALTEVTLKVLPRPECSETMVLRGLDPARAVAAMSQALGSQASIGAAAHLPEPPDHGGPLTLLRIEGVRASVDARADMLRSALAGLGELGQADAAAARAAWAELTTFGGLADAGQVWRINVAPSRAAAIVRALEPAGARWMYDWGGALIWLGFNGDPAAVRGAAAAAGAHAALVRAAPDIRAAVPAFHPQSAPVAALEERVRRAFDPSGVFETGRF